MGAVQQTNQYNGCVTKVVNFVSYLSSINESQHSPPSVYCMRPVAFEI